LHHAYRLARVNAGAPGVDEVTFAQIEERALTIASQEISLILCSIGMSRNRRSCAVQRGLSVREIENVKKRLGRLTLIFRENNKEIA
jgi:hypothetical protein